MIYRVPPFNLKIKKYFCIYKEYEQFYNSSTDYKSGAQGQVDRTVTLYPTREYQAQAVDKGCDYPSLTVIFPLFC